MVVEGGEDVDEFGGSAVFAEADGRTAEKVVFAKDAKEFKHFVDENRNFVEQSWFANGWVDVHVGRRCGDEQVELGQSAGRVEFCGQVVTDGLLCVQQEDAHVVVFLAPVTVFAVGIDSVDAFEKSREPLKRLDARM